MTFLVYFSIDSTHSIVNLPMIEDILFFHYTFGKILSVE